VAGAAALTLMGLFLLIAILLRRERTAPTG
jgi:hypothetical protein